MAPRLPLSDADRTRIRDAVRRAERCTAGEIVPFVVECSGRYEAAIWRGAGIAALVTLGAVALLLRFYQGWGLPWLYDGRGPAVAMLVAGAFGAVAAGSIPPLKRLLAGRARLERAVSTRAGRAFVDEEVFATRDRTGILLFVSLFERRIEVLADAGIHERVEPEAWNALVRQIRDGARAGSLADGLVGAIERCGDLLEREGIGRRPDDRNELRDEARIRDGD